MTAVFSDTGSLGGAFSKARFAIPDAVRVAVAIRWIAAFRRRHLIEAHARALSNNQLRDIGVSGAGSGFIAFGRIRPG